MAKFEMGDTSKIYRQDPTKAVSTIALEYANATDGSGQGFTETLESATAAFTWALQGASTPDGRAAFRAFAEAVLAAHQESQAGAQGGSV